jgi:hypothetical protein
MAKNKKPLLHDVSLLPQEQQQLVEKMLVEGAPFEDVVDAIAEQGECTVTVTAVRNYFRGSHSLQQRRVQHQLETVQALKQAMGQDPESAEARLAEAAILTGFLGLSRKESTLNLNDAERRRLERQNMRLRQQALELQERKNQQDAELLRTRMEVEQTKRRLLEGKILELHRTLNSSSEDDKLGPEVIHKIHEIYGLVKESRIPEEGSNDESQV